MPKDHPSSDYMQARYIALWDAYVKALADPKTQSHSHAIHVAINSPCSRFWISPIEAARQAAILDKNKGEIKYKKGSRMREIFLQVYENYKDLRKSAPFRDASIRFVCTFAVHAEAPCFYISYNRARKILSRISNLRRKYKEEWKLYV